MSEINHLKQWMQELIPFARDQIAEMQQVEQKEDGSPVTEVDKAIEQWLRQKIMQHYPADGIIGEEAEAYQADAMRQWVIDPIDGTRALIAGVPTYTTLIALCDGETPHYAAMLQPITEELWLSDNQQCLWNDSPCNPQKMDNLAAATFSTTSPSLFRDADKPVIDKLIQIARTTELGEDAYAYGKLAKGDVHLIVESGLKAHDFIPLAPIIEGAGGIISDWHGQPIRLNSNGDVIAASSKALHKQALALLNAA